MKRLEEPIAIHFTGRGKRGEAGGIRDKTRGGSTGIEGWEGEEKETDEGYIKDGDIDEGWVTEMVEEREKREG